MTREDITRMAREAGFLVDEADFITTLKNGRIGFQIELERFAALVAEAEREACRQVCFALADAAQEEAYYRGHMECEAAIRARGET
jgi:hypothetical protein